MRTFIKTAIIATTTGAGLLLAAAPSSAAPDDYDYASGAVGEACAYPQGTLALSRNSGIVLTCTENGTWQVSKPAT